MTVNFSWLGFFAMLSVLTLGLAPVNVVRAQDQTEADAQDATIRPQIEEFFTEYAAATRSDTADGLLALFNLEAFVDLVQEQAQIEMPAALHAALVDRLGEATRQEFATEGTAWQRHRVIATTVFQDGKKVEVFVRSWANDGQASRNIFWLEKNDRWQIVDWGDVELGVRNSTLISGIMRETYGANLSKESMQTMNLLNQAFVAARQQDIETAQDRLNAITGQSIPNSMEGLRWIVQASVSLYDDSLATLEAIDKAEGYEPEAMLTDFLRLHAYFGLGEHERVIHHADRYLNRFGADDATYLIKGMAHVELGQIDEALAAFEAGLDDNPQSLDLVVEYGNTLPEDEKAKIAQYVRELPDLENSLASLADGFEVDEEYSALRALLDAAVAMGIEVPNFAYYEGIVLLGQGDPAAALEKLLAARSQLTPDDVYHSYYQTAICRAAVDSSQVMRAYDTCSDKVDCFGSLVNNLRIVLEDEQADVQVRSKAEATTKELVAKHLMTHSADFKTLQILGDQAFYAEDYDKAKTHYESALEFRQNDEDLSYILSNLVACYIETDSIVDFYKSSDFKQQVYEFTAYRIAFDSPEHKELESLHQSNFPNLPEFVLSRMNTLYAERRYQEALDASESVEEEDDEEMSYLQEQIDFVRVLCLARVGKYDDAIISARQLDGENVDRARAAIFVMRNDRVGFRGAIQRLIDSGYEASREDLEIWVDVPDAWITGLAIIDSDEEMLSNTKYFDPYQQIRRLIFLADEPIHMEALSVREAATEAGLTVFEIHREQLLSEQDNYICTLSGDSAVVCSSGYKFFLTKHTGKFLNQFSSAGIEYEEEDEALQSKISDHSSWFSIDIFSWPQVAGIDRPSAIPEDAVRSMIRMSEIILGGKATVIIHRDALVAVGCDDDTFARLTESPFLDTLLPTED